MMSSAIKSLATSSGEKSPQASLVWPTSSPADAAEEVASPPSGASSNSCKSDTLEWKLLHVHNLDECRHERYPTEALQDEELMGARRLRRIKRRLFLAAVNPDQSFGIKPSNNSTLQMAKESTSSNKLPSWERNQSFAHLNRKCKSVSARCA